MPAPGVKYCLHGKHAAAPTYHVLLELWAEGAVQAARCGALCLGCMAVQKVLTDPVQVGKWNLPPKSFICHNQECEVLLPQPVEGVLVACDGDLVLA